MEEKTKQLRALAVQRFKAGESAESICTSLGKSRFWLYKWLKRFDEGGSSWFEEHSRRPRVMWNRTLFEIEEIVKMIRLNLYNRDLSVAPKRSCGRWKIWGLSRCHRSEQSTGFSPGIA